LSREQNRGGERQDELRFDQGEAQAQPGEVRARPQSEGGAETQGDDAIELRVQQQQCCRDGREAREYRGRRPWPRREIESPGKTEETEEDPQPSADLRSERGEWHGKQRDDCEREANGEQRD